MVEDVEVIIRSIEDEKTAVDDRIRTRDAIARIDGLEREKASTLALPFPVSLSCLTTCLNHPDAYGTGTKPAPAGGISDGA